MQKKYRKSYTAWRNNEILSLLYEFSKNQALSNDVLINNNEKKLQTAILNAHSLVEWAGLSSQDYNKYGDIVKDKVSNTQDNEIFKDILNNLLP